MRHGDRIVCSGCTNEFDDIEAWRRGRSDTNVKVPEARISVAGLRDIVRTYRYRDSIHVVVDSLPQPYQDQFASFCAGLPNRSAMGSTAMRSFKTSSAG